MNRRVISKILKRKHEDFIASIDDEKVRRMVDQNSIITGGSIVSLLMNDTVKDFDYYFTDYETCKEVARYYVNKFCKMHPDVDVKPILYYDSARVKIIVQSAGITGEEYKDGDYRYFENVSETAAMDYVEKTMTKADETDAEHIDESAPGDEKYRPVFLSANAITLSDKIQLVIRFYGDPEEIHKNYDFVHCMNYWTSSNGKLYLHPQALESILTKELVYQGSLYPLCSVIRTRKFLRTGWYINAGQYLKMCFQISELDMNNIEVLEEQLTGVDAAYFHEVIRYCKKKKEEDPEFKVTTPYLVSIVDKIFG